MDNVTHTLAGFLLAESAVRLRARAAGVEPSPRFRAFAAALRLAQESEKGTRILCMLPDTGERYLTTPLFGEIVPEMNEEELGIHRSTPTFADTVPGIPAPPPAVVTPPAAPAGVPR